MYMGGSHDFLLKLISGNNNAYIDSSGYYLITNKKAAIISNTFNIILSKPSKELTHHIRPRLYALSSVSPLQSHINKGPWFWTGNTGARMQASITSNCHVNFPTSINFGIVSPLNFASHHYSKAFDVNLQCHTVGKYLPMLSQEFFTNMVKIRFKGTETAAGSNIFLIKGHPNLGVKLSLTLMNPHSQQPRQIQNMNNIPIPMGGPGGFQYTPVNTLWGGQALQ